MFFFSDIRAAKKKNFQDTKGYLWTDFEAIPVSTILENLNT